MLPKIDTFRPYIPCFWYDFFKNCDKNNLFEGIIHKLFPCQVLNDLLVLKLSFFVCSKHDCAV